MRVILATSLALLLVSGTAGAAVPNSDSNYVMPTEAYAEQNRRDAARFLMQSTFGPNMASIESLRNKVNKPKHRKLKQWINQQIKLPVTSLSAATQSLAATGDSHAIRPQHMESSWWQVVLTSEDQLRHRTAFALGQIFAIGDAPGLSGTVRHGRLAYHDLLAEHAFGKFEDLLKAVTLSPIMGQYLSMLNNKRANPDKGTHADENFAREIMQLFTIGLYKLNMDGTLQLDVEGKKIPTYTQEDIENIARALTGWTLDITTAQVDINGSQHERQRAYSFPMVPFDTEGRENLERHDVGEKIIFSGDPVLETVIKASTKVKHQQDLNKVIKLLANHPNTAPFISKQLIQRFVTSNPSPEYVERVAKKFKQTKGKLSAVITAILLDDEARNNHPDQDFGKVKEPLIRLGSFWRAFDGHSNTPAPEGFLHFQTLKNTGQMVVSSPSVFNFYRPDHAPSTLFKENGRVAPELEIATEDLLVLRNNDFYRYAVEKPKGLAWKRERDLPLTAIQEREIRINTTTIDALAAQLTQFNAANKAEMNTEVADQLIEYFNLLLMAGSMDTAMKNILKAQIEADIADQKLNGKPKLANHHIAYRTLYLVLSSTQQAIQR